VKVQCNHCDGSRKGIVTISNSSTGHLKQHLLRHHKDLYHNYLLPTGKRQVEEEEERKVEHPFKNLKTSDKKKVSCVQLPISSFVKNGPGFEDAYLEWQVKMGNPFETVYAWTKNARG
jgi:hypothetical protein